MIRTIKRMLPILMVGLSLMANAQEKIKLKVSDRSVSIILADTEAARSLKARVKDSPVAVRLDDYGGFEKVGELPWSLPADDTRITTVAGDVMLYQGDKIVIFYGSNTWAYTPLGKIEGATSEGIRELLAGNSVEAVLSDDFQTGIAGIAEESREEPEVFTLAGIRIDMSGRSLSDLPAGLYIINGKKELIR